MEILDSIVPASSEDGCRTSTAGGPTEGGWSSFGPAEQVKLSEKPPELVAQKDETETGTVVKVDSGTALALAAQVAALEAKLQASEDEKQAMALQLARFETRLMASEEERKATELAEKRKNVRLTKALSEQKRRNASEMQTRLNCERGLRSQLATVREGGGVDLERGHPLVREGVFFTAAEAATSQRSAEYASCCRIGV